ncbi:photosynthetic complex assembly protein PuhC [Rhizobium sp. SG2393]|uniref:photosynthetic complex assembly protein PuhC n=1 Tax=Rhizobium sp. SG2393 TaxID=3276279 RepID=UPI00366D6786
MSSALSLGYLDKRRPGKTARIPAPLIAAAIGLLLFATGAVLFGQTTGHGVVRVDNGRAVAVRDIVLGRAAGDVVTVTDAVTGETIASYAADTGGFVRGSLRAFERMRQISAVPVETPYRLIRWESGHVSLSDTATGERITLEAFGRDNAAAFAALLGNQGGSRQ